MGKYRTVEFGINQTINNQIHLGLKKAEMIELIHQDYIDNGGTEKDWQENQNRIVMKNDYLRSIGSIEVMRAAAKPFIEYCKENGIKKFEKVTREDLESYLKYRNDKGYSPHTLSRDLHFCNKIFSQNIEKREIGLPSRYTLKITKGRSGMPQNRPGLVEKYKDEITFVKSSGARRASVNRVEKSDFIYKGNEPVQVRLLEKGGKERLSYILPQYRKQLKEILSKAPDSGPIFTRPYDRHINSHYFRHEYAINLINQLQYEKEHNIAFYRGEIEPQGRLSKHDQERYPNGFRGYDKEVCIECSSCLGHERIEILKNYLYNS